MFILPFGFHWLTLQGVHAEQYHWWNANLVCGHFTESWICFGRSRSLCNGLVKQKLAAKVLQSYRWFWMITNGDLKCWAIHVRGEDPTTWCMQQTHQRLKHPTNSQEPLLMFACIWGWHCSTSLCPGTAPSFWGQGRIRLATQRIKIVRCFKIASPVRCYLENIPSSLDPWCWALDLW